MAGSSGAEVMGQMEYATAVKIQRRHVQARIDNLIDLRAKRKAENRAWFGSFTRPGRQAVNGAPQKELCNGAPERIRTSDPQIRSLMLYPAELRARGSETVLKAVIG